MLDIASLKEYGADTENALKRCMGNEAFYFRLIKMAAEDGNFKKLDEAFEASDIEQCFEAAHAIKGVVGNLGLTPLYDAATELTELLRPLQPCDCSAQVESVRAELGKLKELIGE
jgi:HPt (histidine-containing phosphotransfer) domain-containing protein